MKSGTSDKLIDVLVSDEGTLPNSSGFPFYFRCQKTEFALSTQRQPQHLEKCCSGWNVWDLEWGSPDLSLSQSSVTDIQTALYLRPKVVNRAFFPPRAIRRTKWGLTWESSLVMTRWWRDGWPSSHAVTGNFGLAKAKPWFLRPQEFSNKRVQ